MKDPRTEGVLASLGIKYEYWPEYPLSKLVSDEATQVRFAVNRARRREVERYRDMLKAGAEFYPVVLLKDGRLVDGNTRWAAYTSLKKQVLPAYVCDTGNVIVARRLGVELNASHGNRMEREELANWLASGNGSVSDEDAQRVTGWSPRTVQRVRAALQFEARRTKLVIPLKVALPDDVKARLTQVTDPEVFRDLVRLAEEAGLKGAQLTQIVKEVNEAARTDVAAAKRLVSERRDDLAQLIEERRAGIRGTTPLLQQMSMHLGWVIKQGPSALHDTNPHTRDRAQRLLEEALEVVKGALARY